MHRKEEGEKEERKENRVKAVEVKENPAAVENKNQNTDAQNDANLVI